MKKKIIMLTIMFFAIGFAAVSTTLIINSTSSIGTNEEDFDVYFSEAILDTEDVSDKVISEDKLSINYKTKDLLKMGDTSILEYKVVNASKNYDAEVNVTCTGETEIASITQSPENQIVLAGTSNTGNVTVTLNKNVIEEKEIPFTCTLNVSAVERTELGEEYRECEYAIGTIWDFDYKGAEQEFVVPCDGTYKIELWGAQGGYSYTETKFPGGYGAYAIGSTDLLQNTKLYIYVGGEGNYGKINTPVSGGYNGGGTSGTYPTGTIDFNGSGGGLTHIAFINGELNQLSYSNISDILIVSGGGGGSTHRSIYADGNYAGHAGGIVGVASSYVGNFMNGIGYGGTQSSGGISTNGNYTAASFGQGGTYNNTQSNYNCAGGGGGLYGGGFCGGGGSSYIGNTLLTDKAMYCYNCQESSAEDTKTISTTNVSENPISKYAKQGNGYAKITLVS